MKTPVSIRVNGTPTAFDLDIEGGAWTSAARIHESEFPLVTEVDGKRFELYSDGKLNEQELP